MVENYITEIDILDEAKDNFLTYSAEVLTDRAIPAAEDGLLSAQRKLLWTMEDYLKLNSKSKTKKCNAIVGSTLATSYFHGDAACYGVLCKMSQEYLMRYPLVTGQGSLGTQESNDMVASSRYTEAKPSIYADLMMNDFKKNVVPLKETYNGEFMEPVVLPSLFPNAIVNGKQAIGISMAHNSLPHNLKETCDAIIACIKKGSLTIDELMQYMKGPDFPLHNIIINAKDIRYAFMTGKSSVSLKVRGNYTIKDNKIIFDTIPYRTYRNKIREQIAKNIDVLEDFIDDFNDESNLGKNRLVFSVKRGVHPEKAVLKLFALTDLQTTLSYNMNYIVNGTPKLCSMIDLIKIYISHQSDILIKTAEFDKQKAEARLHIINGLLLILADIDKAIQLIKTSDNKQIAEERLIENFNLDSIQAKAVLNMRLSSLTKLDQDELLKELKEKKDIIEKCNNIINDTSFRNMVLIEKIQTIKDKYGDERKTELFNLTIEKEEKPKEEIVEEDVVVTLTQSGGIKRVPKNSYKTQKRRGKGIRNVEEVNTSIISTNTLDNLLLFTKKGKMLKVPVNNIPEGSNVSKATPINSFTKLDSGDEVVAATALQNEAQIKYVLFFTKKGLIKKTNFDEYTKIKSGASIIAIKINDGDSLANVAFVKDENVIVVTKKGMAIHFETKNINAIGRNTAGVKAIRLDEDDSVVKGIPIDSTVQTLGIFSYNGYGKKIAINEMSVQGRGGKGLIIYKFNKVYGPVIGAIPLKEDDTILLSGYPNSICISEKEVPLCLRSAYGNMMIKGTLTAATKL